MSPEALSTHAISADYAGGEPSRPQANEKIDGRFPLELITGFLGSGKSTLVNRLLRAPAFAKTVVVINEFGEVGVDQALVSSHADGVVLLNSGCLCCGVTGTLGDTLVDLLSRRANGSLPPFHRIIVETSGLANPAPLIAGLLGDTVVSKRCFLANVVTIVDGLNGPTTLERYSEARRQVALADRLLVSKADVVAPDAVERALQAARLLNPHAFITASATDQEVLQLFEARFGFDRLGEIALKTPEHLPASHQHGSQGSVHGEAFDHISSHTLLLPQQFEWSDYARYTHILQKRFKRKLLRCKGILRMPPDGAAWLIQGVQGYFAPPQRLEAWPTDTPRGYLVFIGEDITGAELKAIFESEKV